MRRLNDLIINISPKQIRGSINLMIESVCTDSRKCGKNSLFVAIRGTSVDGHNFIEKSIQNGAVAVVCENLPDNIQDGIAYIQVSNSAEALGFLCSEFYDNPSRKLKLVGVTGTNGKTTVATLLYRMAMNMGYPSGLFSTVYVMVNNQRLPATHTTPDALELNRIMAQMVDAGCEYCFMEVSSHSVVQHRISGLKFEGAIFTNLTQDHLDYHKTMAAYIQAKKQFFDQLEKTAFALFNIDDRNGSVMVQNCKAKIFSYGLERPADFKAKILSKQMEGMLLEIEKSEVWVKLTGEFNAYNLLAVYGASCQLGFDKAEVLRCLSLLEPAQGRFDRLRSKSGIFVIVDYAHTPDAVANVLKTISDIRTGNEKVITVIGAGGDRDKTKRPLMAREAAQLSDVVILTSDNPRSEDPIAIIEDMKQGLKPRSNFVSLINPDRREAIKTALSMAAKDDIVLIAGKGHENYQEIKGIKYPFDDKEIALTILAELEK